MGLAARDDRALSRAESTMMQLRTINEGGTAMARITRTAAAAMALGMLAACQTEPATVERTSEVTATVTAIELPERLVTLRGPEGNLFTVQAGEEVRNLPQVEVGDRVVVRYYEAIAAELAKTGEEAGASVAAMRAPPGAKPGAGLGQQVTATVEIVAVDPTTHTVSFTDPDGIAQTIAVHDPEMQDFVETLKAGDEVAVTYTEALAISVEPASP
jgi:hypothetical protein